MTDIGVGTLAWNVAMEGLAVARDMAVGGMAHAAQSNNDLATQFIKGSGFFQRMEILSRYVVWMNLLWLLPLSGWWRLKTNRPAIVKS